VEKCVYALVLLIWNARNILKMLVSLTVWQESAKMSVENQLHELELW